MKSIVLASTSPFRRQLLERLGLPFDTANPAVDESSLPGETPDELVRRLAEAKARAVAGSYPQALIIGSDQVAVLGEKVLGKPLSHERALEQLRACTGNRVEFLTGLCVLDAESGRVQVDLVRFAVVFRQLTETQIEHYLQREQPYQCAGSFKSEGLGIALFSRMEGEDPNALIGLPLIRLIAMLENEGIEVL